MKNKLFYAAVVVFSVVLLTSCASRKYGCPNSTGMKVEVKTQGLVA